MRRTHRKAPGRDSLAPNVEPPTGTAEARIRVHRRFGLRPDAFLLVCFGFVHPVKGIRDVLEALPPCELSGRTCTSRWSTASPSTRFPRTRRRPSTRDCDADRIPGGVRRGDVHRLPSTTRRFQRAPRRGCRRVAVHRRRRAQKQLAARHAGAWGAPPSPPSRTTTCGTGRMCPSSRTAGTARRLSSRCAGCSPTAGSANGCPRVAGRLPHSDPGPWSPMGTRPCTNGCYRRDMGERYSDILVADLLGGIGDLRMVLPGIRSGAPQPRAAVPMLTHEPAAARPWPGWLPGSRSGSRLARRLTDRTSRIRRPAGATRRHRSACCNYCSRTGHWPEIDPGRSARTVRRLDAGR
jgi:hypothetical protein